MGLEDWMDEFLEQEDEEDRKAARKRYKNDTTKLARKLAEIDARAARRQGRWQPPPPLDLSTMSREELEILREETQIDIEQGEEILKQTEGQSNQGGLLSQLVMGGSVALVQAKLAEKKKLLAAINIKLKNQQSLPPAQPVVSPGQAKIAAIAKLMKERDDLKAQNPADLHADIDRVYGKMIDDERKKP